MAGHVGMTRQLGDVTFTLNEIRETQIWETPDWEHQIEVSVIQSGREQFGYDWRLSQGGDELASGQGAATAGDAVYAAIRALQARQEGQAASLHAGAGGSIMRATFVAAENVGTVPYGWTPL